MTAERYLRSVKAIHVGKRVNRFLYLHKQTLQNSSQILNKWIIFLAEQFWPDLPWNVVKLNLKKPLFSTLYYPLFHDDEHPTLLHSVSFDAGTKKLSIRRFKQSSNPPILHRKEAFLLPNHPDFDRFKSLTQAATRKNENHVCFHGFLLLLYGMSGVGVIIVYAFGFAFP